MKLTFKIAFFLMLLAVLVLPGVAQAKDLYDDKIVAGGSFTLQSEETLNGNLLIFGGVVTLEEGSTVNGDVVLMGGTLSIDGLVTRNVVGIGGVVSLLSNAHVQGDLTAVAASLDRAAGSVVEGQVITGLLTGPFVRGPITIPEAPNFEVRMPRIFSGIWFLFRTFLWSALAVLLVMFLPNHTDRVASAIIRQPVLTGAVGLLTGVIAPLLLIAIALTIILIPISLIGGLVLVVAWFLGRIALGFEIGRRLAESANQDWPLAISAGIGTFLLTLVVDGINLVVPCVGWLLPALVGVLGLGGVLLTRFGTQIYPPYPGMQPMRPEPPAPMPPSAPVSPLEMEIPGESESDAELNLPPEEPPAPPPEE